MNRTVKRIARWWYRRQRFEAVVWALYDAGLLRPDAPPPFPRPRLPGWIRDDVIVRKRER